MKCQQCQQRDATVHDVLIKGGKRAERHLCDRCARAQGLPVPGGSASPQIMHTLISAPGLVVSATNADPASQAAAQACPCCQTTFAAFRTSGQLGCAECYGVFAALLAGPLERWHEGGVTHAGKVPRRFRPGDAPGGHDPAAQARASALEQEALRAALNQAIAREQYERAAEIRDRLRALQTGSAQISTLKPGAPTQPPPAGAQGPA